METKSSPISVASCVAFTNAWFASELRYWLPPLTLGRRSTSASICCDSLGMFTSSFFSRNGVTFSSTLSTPFIRCPVSMA